MKLSEKVLLGVLLGAVFSFSLGTVFILALFLTAICLIKCIKTDSRSFLIKLFIFGFALRVLLAFANYNIALMVMHQGVDTQPDAVIYNNNAYYLAHLIKGFDYSFEAAKDPALDFSMKNEDKWLKGMIPTSLRLYQHGLYVRFLSLIYAWLGYCPLAMKALNCLFGSGSAILIYLIARHLSGSETVSKVSAAVAMFFPSLVFWSATLLRDTIVNFIFLMYMISLLIYIKSAKKTALALALPSIAILNLFKEHIMPLLVIGLIFVLTAGMVKKMFKMKRYVTLLAAVFIIIGLSIMLLPKAYSRLSELRGRVISVIGQQQSYSVDRVAATYRLFKSSLYESHKFRLRDLFDPSLSFSALKGLAYFFLSPFPWRAPYDHFWLLIFYPQAILTFIFLPFILIGLLVSARRDIYVTAVMVLVLALIIIPNALAEGVIGIVVRHRDMFTPFLIIFASYGFCSLMLPKNTSK